MFIVKEKYSGAHVHCAKFSVNLSKATQDQLEHLYHIGHVAIEITGKKPKNKPVDNFVANNDIDIADEQKNA